MKTNKLLLFLLSAALLLPACKESSILLPSVSGKAGEIIVVMEKSDWENNLGNDVREILNCDTP